MPAFGKTRPLTIADFAPFEAAYGNEPNGGAARIDEGPEGRFRCFPRADILARNDNLDITWLRDDSDAVEDDLSDPEDIAAAILGHLRAALAEVEAVDAELAGEEAAPAQVLL
jgi:type I restriction enzyme M protein